MRPLELVVAADEANGIGKDNALPWRLSKEMAHFKRLTSEAAAGKQNAVLMGRATFESIPAKFRPLAGRLNIVLSRGAFQAEGAHVAHSLDEALAIADTSAVDRVFVIGGGALYRLALAHPACARIYLTRLHARFACDTFLPDFAGDFACEQRDGPHAEAGLTYCFERWERRVNPSSEA